MRHLDTVHIDCDHHDDKSVMICCFDWHLFEEQQFVSAFMGILIEEFPVYTYSVCKDEFIFMLYYTTRSRTNNTDGNGKKYNEKMSAHVS